MKTSKWFLEKPIAHRGFHWIGGIDENSYEAFEEGISRGFPLELDVHLSRDGVPFVHHDLSLERMTGHDVRATSLVATDLKKMKLPHSKKGVPLLKDILELVNGRVPLVIELKRTRDDSHLELAVESILTNYKGEYSIQSFHPKSLLFFRDSRLKPTTGLLSGRIHGSLKEEDLRYSIRLMLGSLCLVPFLKPDYIGYEWQGLNDGAPQRMREKYQIPLIGWTVKNNSSQDFCSRFGDNIIFENLTL